MVLWLLSTAHAAVPVEIEVGTQFPLDFGVGARLDLPGRLYTGVRVGFLPSANVDAINAFATAIGAYGDPTAEVIRSTIGESLVLSVDAGWRPFVGDRWTRLVSFQAGYVVGTLGGDLATQDVLASAFDLDFPEEAGANTTYDLGATVHLVRAEVMIQPELTERLHLDLGLGAAFTVAAKASAEVTSSPEDGRFDSAATTLAIENVLEETFRRYVHTPTLRVGLGWRL